MKDLPVFKGTPIKCEQQQACPLVGQQELILALARDLTTLRERLEPVIEAWESLAGTARVLGFIGAVLRWGAIVGGALVGIYMAYYNGNGR